MPLSLFLSLSLSFSLSLSLSLSLSASLSLSSNFTLIFVMVEIFAPWDNELYQTLGEFLIVIFIEKKMFQTLML